MQYAMTSSFEKILPSKGLAAICPQCENEVIAKCGNINVWHWAHKTLLNCKYFERNETEWHRNWKARFLEEYREIRFPAYDSEGKKTAHIADVYLRNIDLAIEFQHSRITYEECIQRNEFYADNGGIDWIIDISDANYTFNKNVVLKDANPSYDHKKETELREELFRLKEIKEKLNSVSDYTFLPRTKKDLQDAIDFVNIKLSEHIENKYNVKTVDEVILHSKRDIILNIYPAASLYRGAHCYLDTGKGNIAMIQDVRDFKNYLMIIIGRRVSYEEYLEMQFIELA